MKKIHSLVCFLVAIATLLSGCMPSFYFADPVHSPGISKKNDLELSGSLGITRTAPQMFLQTAWSPKDNWVVTASLGGRPGAWSRQFKEEYFSFSSSGFIVKQSSSMQYGRSMIASVGGGKTSMTRSGRMSLFGGVSYGKTRHLYFDTGLSSDQQPEKVSGQYYRIYAQPEWKWPGKKRTFVKTLRLSYIHYDRFSFLPFTQIFSAKTVSSYYQSRPNWVLFLESAYALEFGRRERIKWKLQGALSISLLPILPAEQGAFLPFDLPNELFSQIGIGMVYQLNSAP